MIFKCFVPKRQNLSRMSFIEDYDVVISSNDILYRRQNMKKICYNRLTEKDLNEGTMLQFPTNHLYFSHKAKTHSISSKHKFLRSGVIPYTVVNEKKYFCLGVDAKYGTLTDFGGGLKRGEDFVIGACRELQEESLGIFDFTSEEKIKKVRENSVTIYDSSVAVIFVNVKIENMNHISELYYHLASKQTRLENSGIIWIPEDVFFFLIKSGKTIRSGKFIYPSVYKLVNDLLRSVSNINEIL